MLVCIYMCIHSVYIDPNQHGLRRDPRKQIVNFPHCIVLLQDDVLLFKSMDILTTSGYEPQAEEVHKIMTAILLVPTVLSVVMHSRRILADVMFFSWPISCLMAAIEHPLRTGN